MVSSSTLSSADTRQKLHLQRRKRVKVNQKTISAVWIRVRVVEAAGDRASLVIEVIRAMQVVKAGAQVPAALQISISENSKRA